MLGVGSDLGHGRCSAKRECTASTQQRELAAIELCGDREDIRAESIGVHPSVLRSIVVVSKGHMARIVPSELPVCPTTSRLGPVLVDSSRDEIN